MALLCFLFDGDVVVLVIFEFYFSSFRYYRANTVRHSTSLCDSVCALNHYCAITRVDYREYKECFKTAASALASASRPILLCKKNNFNTNLLIFAVSQLATSFLLYQRNVILILVIILNCIVELYVNYLNRAISLLLKRISHLIS